MIVLVGFGSFILMGGLLGATQYEESLISLVMYVSLAWIIFYWAIIFLAGIRRIKDLDRNPWFALLLLIPYLNIVVSLSLIFIEGTVGPNQYGPDPKRPNFNPGNLTL